MTFSNFPITVSKNYFNKKCMKSIKFVYLFTTSDAKLDVDRIVFLIKLAGKNSIVW